MIDYKLHDIPFSCDLTIADSERVLRLVLRGYANLECNLTCPICLDGVYGNAVSMSELNLLLK
ncbi:hypothetical protein Hanom_Chr17g01538971 [Helianthus anomalus]